MHDKLSIGLIICFTVMMIVNWEGLPIAETDAPYHLLMGKMYSDYGRIVLWDYYEFAPIGRPQLYPPFLHTLIWWIHDLTKLDFWSIGKIFSLVQYSLSLFSVWFFTKKIFDSKIAFASVCGLLTYAIFWRWEGSVAPTAFIVAFYPIFLYFFYKRNFLASVILLTMFLYSHLGIPYVFILSVLIFSIVEKEYRKFFLKVVGVSFLLFSPWIVHLFLNRSWIATNSTIFPLIIFSDFNIVGSIFILAGIYYIFKNISDKRYKLVLASFISFFPIIFMYSMRYKIHSPIINSIVFGIGAVYIFSKIRVKYVFVITLLLTALFSPTIYLPYEKINIQYSNLAHEKIAIETPFLLMVTKSYKDSHLFGFEKEDIDELIEWIKENTPEDEILHVIHGPLGCYITLMTGRCTDVGMYAEARSENTFREIIKNRKSGIFIFEKRIFETMPDMEILSVFGNIIVATPRVSGE